MGACWPLSHQMGPGLSPADGAACVWHLICRKGLTSSLADALDTTTNLFSSFHVHSLPLFGAAGCNRAAFKAVYLGIVCLCMLSSIPDLLLAWIHLVTFRLKPFSPYPCVSTALRKLLPSKGHKRVAVQLQRCSLSQCVLVQMPVKVSLGLGVLFMIL